MEPRIYALQRIKPGAERRLRSQQQRPPPLEPRDNRLIWRDRRCEWWRCHTLRDHLPKQRSCPDLPLWNHRYPGDGEDDKSGHSVYAAGYRSSGLHFKGSVVRADVPAGDVDGHYGALRPFRNERRQRLRAFHVYYAFDAGLDAGKRLPIERGLAANSRVARRALNTFLVNGKTAPPPPLILLSLPHPQPLILTLTPPPLLLSTSSRLRRGREAR
jgi:hypothetical protein